MKNLIKEIKDLHFGAKMQDGYERSNELTNLPSWLNVALIMIIDLKNRKETKQDYEDEIVC